MMGISVSTLLPLYWKEELSFSSSKISLLNAIAVTIAFIAPLFFGWFGANRKLEKFIRICFWATAFVSPIFLGYSNFIIQALLFGAIQFFRCGYLTFVPVGVLNLLGKNAASDYGKYRRVGSVGFLVGIIGAGYLIKATSTKWIFLFIGLSAIIASIPFIKKLKIPSPKTSSTSYSDIFKTPGMVYFYLATSILITELLIIKSRRK